MHTESRGSSRGTSTTIITRLATSTATHPRQSPSRCSDTMRWFTLVPRQVRHAANPLKAMANRANHIMPLASTFVGELKRSKLSCNTTEAPLSRMQALTKAPSRAKRR